MSIIYGKNNGPEIIPLTEVELEDKAGNVYKRGFFSAKEEEIYADFLERGKERVYYGLGKEGDLDSYRIFSFNVKKFLKKQRIGEAYIDAREMTDQEISAIMEGFFQADYSFDRYKKNKGDSDLKLGLFTNKGKEEFYSLLERVENLYQGIKFCRDLINTPANDMTPRIFAKTVGEKFSGLPVSVEIFGKKEIEDLSMKAFLSVSQGSGKEPVFLVAKYLPIEGEKPLVLVGKGITYDSGGYHVKDYKYMRTMFSDMAGAATAFSTLYSLAKNGIKRNVIAVSALCENMISRDSYRNGDIISTMKGKTVEIVDTDAEGRLTLADAIYYSAKEFSPSLIIDLATLTGSCVIGLGPITTGAMTNDQASLDKLILAGKKAGEYIWQLPLYKELDRVLDSDIADMKNDIDGSPGAMVAGVFLREFAEGKPWIHLDIAGTAYQTKERKYLPKRATSEPLKSLYFFIDGEGEK